MKHHEFIEGISNILARKKLINSSDIKSLNKSFDNRDDITFEDFLVEEALVTKDDLLLALSEYYQLPAMDVVGEFFSHRLLRLFPKEVLLEHFVVPHRREGDVLYVVAAEPKDPHLREVLGRYITHDISFMVGLAQDIKDTIREFYDESITYQPNHLESALMERSEQEVHPIDEIRVEGHPDERIPFVNQETDDDYEK